MFSEDYLEEVLIPNTNKGLSVPMDLQEFIKWVGCWLYMAFWFGIESRRYWWSTTAPSMAKGALFRINRIMYCNQYDYILSDLSFTNREVPYEDGFFRNAPIGGSLEPEYGLAFFPSWINVIDESIWIGSKSGLLDLCVSAVNRTPLAMSGIQFFCALTSILWRAHIVEGKDRQTQLCKKKWEELEKTVGLMLRMCKIIFSTGKCVVLDSGFCVSKGITALLKFGVYAAALIKKNKYCTKGVPGDAIDQYFADKDVTYVYMLEAITASIPLKENDRLPITHSQSPLNFIFREAKHCLETLVL